MGGVLFKLLEKYANCRSKKSNFKLMDNLFKQLDDKARSVGTSTKDIDNFEHLFKWNLDYWYSDDADINLSDK